MAEIDHLIQDLKNWFYAQSNPNSHFAYNRCPVCGCTWWQSTEKAIHNIGCWIPSLFSDLRDKDEEQLRARIAEMEKAAKELFDATSILQHGKFDDTENGQGALKRWEEFADRQIALAAALSDKKEGKDGQDKNE